MRPAASPTGAKRLSPLLYQNRPKDTSSALPCPDAIAGLDPACQSSEPHPQSHAAMPTIQIAPTSATRARVAANPRRILERIVKRLAPAADSCRVAMGLGFWRKLGLRRNGFRGARAPCP